MKATLLIAIISVIVFGISCKEQKNKESGDMLIGNGKMPNMARDNAGNSMWLMEPAIVLCMQLQPMKEAHFPLLL